MARTLGVVVSLCLALAACGSSEEEAPANSGGTAGSGGSSGGGGSAGKGPGAGSSGASGTAGASGKGGSAGASGGSGGQAGSAGKGGSAGASAGSGGSSGQGGSAGSGGSSAGSGGSSAGSGGSSAGSGGSSAGSGGSSAGAGGSSAGSGGSNAGQGGSAGSGGKAGAGGSAGQGGSAGSSGQGGTGGSSGQGGSAGGGGSGQGGGGSLDKVRFFLSGHSLTDNPMPDHVLSIASSMGKGANYEEQIGIGSPIRVRTKGNDPNASGWPGYSSGKNRNGSNMNVIEELKSPKSIGPGELYDTLLLTERHDVLETIRWENTVGYVRHFHDRLIAGNPAGRTLLYHSWLSIDKGDPSPWISHEKVALVAWECAASKVNLTLEAAGRPDRVTPLPVGAALVSLVEKVLAGEVAGISGSVSQRLNALFNDNVHMTPLGAYYVALATYAGMFGASPVGAWAPSGVNPSTAADLQQIAWAYMSQYYAQPSAGVRTMAECRSTISSQLCQSTYTLLGYPQNISWCTQQMGNPSAEGNPFRWPDPSFVPFPDP